MGTTAAVSMATSPSPERAAAPLCSAPRLALPAALGDEDDAAALPLEASAGSTRKRCRSGAAPVTVGVASARRRSRRRRNRTSSPSVAAVATPARPPSTAPTVAPTPPLLSLAGPAVTTTAPMTADREGLGEGSPGRASSGASCASKDKPLPPPTSSAGISTSAPAGGGAVPLGRERGVPALGEATPPGVASGASTSGSLPKLSVRAEEAAGPQDVALVPVVA